MLMDYIDEVRARYDAWWRGENHGPLVYMIHPLDGADLSPAVKPWMAPACVRGWTAWKHEFIFGQAVELAAKTGQMHYVDEAADLLERHADATGRVADGYHFLFVNVGASMMSALLTGVTHFDGETIWLEMDEPLSLNQILAMDPNTESAYATVAFAAMERLAERLKGRYVLAIPELGGLLDVLSAMRRVGNLLYDTVDEPEKLDRAAALLQQMWWRFHRRMSAIVDGANPSAYAQSMRLLSGTPSHMATCDFSAMLGPDAFARWVLPQIRGETEQFPGRVFFHLDGPGELVHLDALLSLPGLRAIQWVPGAGNDGGLHERWHGLYRRILDAGKCICLSGVPSQVEPVQTFFRLFPAERFFLGLSARDRRQAEQLARGLGR